MREGYTDLRSAAELALVAARHALNAEISSYPTPISGCDAQFNHLLAERYTVVTWNNVPGDWLEPRRAWLDKALAELARQDWSVLVLHDHCQADMMELLESFLDHVARAGIELRTDFPPSCLPVVDGVLMLERSAISSPPSTWIGPRS